MDTSETVFLPSDRDASGRSLGEEELQLLREVIEGGNLFCVPGNMVPRFERAFAELYGVPHARAVTSGTAAVHTALGALDIAPGDEIITTPITDMGAITPILFQGAVPVYADVDRDTLNISADTIRPRITERTRAIIVTHLFGRTCSATRATWTRSWHWPPSTICRFSKTRHRPTWPHTRAGCVGHLVTSPPSVSSREST